MQVKPLRVVLRAEPQHRVAKDSGRRWNLRQHLAIWAAELQLPIRLAIELVALLMNRPVVEATEQREIGERSGAAVGPMLDVMSLAKPHAAAGEPAAAVSMVERAP